MSASAAPDDDVFTASNLRNFDRRLSEHGTMIGALERGHRSTQAMVRSLHADITATKSSVHSIAEDVGSLTQHQARIEEKVDGLTRAFSNLSDRIGGMSEDFRRHQQKCNIQHREIDGRFESFDDFDVDTSVYDSMTGKEVKTVLESEKVAREVLEQKVNNLQKQAEIHTAEKKAVEAAKDKWMKAIEQNENERRVTEQERTKLRIARYSMYGVVIAGILTIIGNVLVAVLK